METHSEGEWLEQTAQQAQRLFGFVKGGAGNLIKNIKDTSSKMMQTVAGYVSVLSCVYGSFSIYQTISFLFCRKRTSLDISYITSRILG